MTSILHTQLEDIDSHEVSACDSGRKQNLENSDGSEIFLVESISWIVESKTILDDISFSIKQGEFVGLIGPNGAGKSSLLRCLYGKNKPTSGTVFFREKRLQNYSRREVAQHIAVLVQEPPTQFDLSVYDVVALGLIPHRPLLSLASENDRQIVQRAIQKVELVDKLQDPFDTLSGGEKQRVMVARAIVQRTQVLILDEPTNHLDVQHQVDVLKLAKEMQVTVLLSIHDLNMASAFCDRLILMNEGKIVTSGSPQRVLTQQNLKEVFNISAQVDAHPFHLGNRITFDFGLDQ